MDQEVARALSDLEQKMLEFERTLESMRGEEPPAPLASAPVAPAPRGFGSSRIVDERMESSAPAEPPAPAWPYTSATGTASTAAPPSPPPPVLSPPPPNAARTP